MRTDKLIEMIFREANVHDAYSDFDSYIGRNLCKVICDNLGINVHFISRTSEINNMNGEWNLFLNSEQELYMKWYEFGTLLGVYFKEVDENGIFDNTLNFAERFCIPTFMLDKLDFLNLDEPLKVHLIADKFKVNHCLAYRRLEIYNQQQSGFPPILL